MTRLAVILLSLCCFDAGVLIQTPAPGLEGTWRGTLGTGANSLRLVLRIARSADGLFTGALESLDQNSTIPIDPAIVNGVSVRLELKAVSGTFEGTKDGIPENVPGPTSRAVPITIETIGGNHVVLDLGQGRYAFYAHLQPGSLRVKPGDRVKRGEVIGLVGNSGNSTEPHLHFHVSDGASPLGSEGLPYGIIGMTGMPLQNARVSFDRRVSLNR